MAGEDEGPEHGTPVQGDPHAAMPDLPQPRGTGSVSLCSRSVTSSNRFLLLFFLWTNRMFEVYQDVFLM